jgi:sRNA-binding regulator protein Hfq
VQEYNFLALRTILNDQRRTPVVQSKPGGSPGISRAEFEDLKKQISALDTKLADALSERNQWNHVLRKWAEEGKQVTFSLLTGGMLSGKIEWIDRYTIGLIDNGNTYIIHKGAIATIRR